MTNKLLKLAILLANCVFCVSDMYSTADPYIANLCVDEIVYRLIDGYYAVSTISIRKRFLRNEISIWGRVYQVVTLRAGLRERPCHLASCMLFVPHQVEEIIKHAGLIGLVNYNGITQVVFENCNPAIVIKDGAFQNWPDLQTICIPKGVTTIGNHVFFGCKSLYCVTFAPKSQLESIGSNAFSGCSRLSVVRFSGKQLREIGDYAFEACALWSIEIPESVTNMGNWVFGRCPRLEVAIIHSGLRVGHDVFTNCRSLRCVMIVSEAETINEDYYSQLLGILLDGQVTFELCHITQPNEEEEEEAKEEEAKEAKEEEAKEEEEEDELERLYKDAAKW